eukprot:3668867-Lingulodinium_polyedra.AAC.1
MPLLEPAAAAAYSCPELLQRPLAGRPPFVQVLAARPEYVKFLELLDASGRLMLLPLEDAPAHRCGAFA